MPFDLPYVNIFFETWNETLDDVASVDLDDSERRLSALLFVLDVKVLNQ